MKMENVFGILFILFAVLVVIVVAKRFAKHPFKCKNCGGEFYIKWQKIIITQHVGDEYFLLCPHCKTICWCVKQAKK